MRTTKKAALVAKRSHRFSEITEISAFRSAKINDLKQLKISKRDSEETFPSIRLDFPIGATELVAFPATAARTKNKGNAATVIGRRATGLSIPVHDREKSFGAGDWTDRGVWVHKLDADGNIKKRPRKAASVSDCKPSEKEFDHGDNRQGHT